MAPYLSDSKKYMDHPFASLSLRNNPLLLGPGEIRFDLIEPEHIVPAVRAIILQESASQNYITDLKSSERTVENTLLAIDRLGMPLSEVWSIVSELKNLVGSDQINQACKEVEPEVMAFQSKIFLSPELYQALNEFSSSENLAGISPSQSRLLDRLIKTFELNGVSLPAEQRERLSDLDTQLATKATQFGNNLKTASKAFEIVLDQPPFGVPEDVIARASENAKKKGQVDKYNFGCDAGTYDAIMKFATDRELRKEMHCTFHSRCLSGELENITIAEEELSLRHEKARILKEGGISGIDTFADYTAALRVAKNGANIMGFLGELEKSIRPAFERERQELAHFAREFENDPSFSLQAWDTTFYSERLRENRCGFKEQEVKPYLEESRFIAASFSLAERLYGIRFEPNKTLSVWHDDVKAFDIISSSAERLGSFYIDLYSRSGEKRDGAWQDTFIHRHPDIVGHDKWVGLLACNFPRPAEGKPCLLALREAETFLHEFGHLLQQLAVNSPEVLLSGPPWDAIEIPSQLHENYFWQREFFMKAAVHFETGKPCPEELFDKLQMAHNFQKASNLMAQVGFSLLDMTAHTDENIAAGKGLRQHGHDILSNYSISDIPDYLVMYNRFSHIFSGEYSAGYYSYTFALAMACDCFSHMLKQGIFDTKTAQKYWDTVLAVGDTRDALEGVNEFLERPLSAPIRAGSIADFYGLNSD